jgi:predicted phosphodiesterase/transposase
MDSFKHYAGQRAMNLSKDPRAIKLVEKAIAKGCGSARQIALELKGVIGGRTVLDIVDRLKKEGRFEYRPRSKKSLLTEAHRAEAQEMAESGEFISVRQVAVALKERHGIPMTERSIAEKMGQSWGITSVNRKGAQDPVLKKIKERYTPEELKRIADGGGLAPQTKPPLVVDFKGEVIKFAHFTDTHIGSVFFVRKYLEDAIKEAERQGCSFIAHTGDVLEGLSGRKGQIYELTHTSIDGQEGLAVELFSKWRKPIYFVDGNHDRWTSKEVGHNSVKTIAAQLEKGWYLGQDEGEVRLKGVRVKLFHGEDTSSYATSYRVQKLVESFPGGDKPNVLLVGHTHKQLYAFERHIHCVSGGALSLQSSWMRSKRLAHHAGFWIIEMAVNKQGVAWFQPRWYPFYVG